MAFRFNILGDFFWESGIEKVLETFSDSGYRKFFQEKNYGSTLEGLTVLLMCQDSSLNLKRRIRLSKKERKLYIDILLDLPYFVNISHIERVHFILEKLLFEIPDTLRKYNLEDFDLQRFELDLRSWVETIKPK